jgi:hypothetical protein
MTIRFYGDTTAGATTFGLRTIEPRANAVFITSNNATWQIADAGIPSGTERIWMYVFGHGGKGANSITGGAGTYEGGSGGGGGGCAIKVIEKSGGLDSEVFNITIPSPGSGTNTTVTSTYLSEDLISSPGTDGTFGNSNNVGGTSSGGDFNYTGGKGGASQVDSSNGSAGGGGASPGSYLGPGSVGTAGSGRAGGGGAGIGAPGGPTFQDGSENFVGGYGSSRSQTIVVPSAGGAPNTPYIALGLATLINTTGGWKNESRGGAGSFGSGENATTFFGGGGGGGGTNAGRTQNGGQGGNGGAFAGGGGGGSNEAAGSYSGGSGGNGGYAAGGGGAGYGGDNLVDAGGNGGSALVVVEWD